MKTLTEFNGFDLVGSIKTLQELTAAGKTPEEIQAAFTEQKKLEGDKLKFFMQALAMAQAKSQGLKRVIVFTAQENEKVPSGALKHEEHYYLLEFFPAPPGQQRRPGRDDRGGRGGKGRGDKNGKRGGGRGRPRDGAGRPEIRAGENPGEGGGGHPGGRGRRRPPRGFRPPQQPLLGPDGKPRPAPAIPKPLERPIGTPVTVKPTPQPAPAETTAAPTPGDSSS